MNTKRHFQRPPSIHSYASIFDNKPHNDSPTGTKQYSNSLSPISSPIPKKTNKTVCFNSIVEVVLIPTKKEYFEANIACLIWYSESEKTSFIKSIADQIKILTISNPEMTAKEAFRYLLTFHEEETHHNNENLRLSV